MMMRKFSQILFNRWVRNIIFWLFIAFLHYYPRSSVTGYLLLLVLITIAYGAPVYVNNLWLIPKLLLKRKYGLYCCLFLLLLLLTTLETYYFHSFINKKFPQLNFFTMMNSRSVPYYVFSNVLIFGVTAFGKFMADVIDNERKMETLEQQRLQSELDSLRAQINPHFLFNALNTIYGMARRTDKETADAVLKLSDILRSGLYDGEKNEISLQEEINLVRQYVSFSMLRVKNKEMVDLKIDANVTNQKIVPLILVSFIENAFKHGLGKANVQPAITIRLLLSGHNLLFTCTNEKLPVKSGDRKRDGAIGLKNVKRRLELCYPSRHELVIEDEGERYSVKLKLQLG